MRNTSSATSRAESNERWPNISMYDAMCSVQRQSLPLPLPMPMAMPPMGVNRSSNIERERETPEELPAAKRNKIDRSFAFGEAHLMPIAMQHSFMMAQILSQHHQHNNSNNNKVINNTQFNHQHLNHNQHPNHHHLNHHVHDLNHTIQHQFVVNHHHQHQHQSTDHAVNQRIIIDEHRRHHNHHTVQQQQANNKHKSTTNLTTTSTKLANTISKKSSRSSKRIRTIFTREQLERLEVEFERQMYLVGEDRQYLAKELNLSEVQVKVWFQNRRIKHRKLNPAAVGASTTPELHSPMELSAPNSPQLDSQLEEHAHHNHNQHHINNSMHHETNKI